MSEGTPERRRRVDAVVIRSCIAVALSLTSLVLVVADVKLSLIPFVLGFGLITHGKEMRGRNAPPIAFLLMIPVGIAIGIVWFNRS